MNLPAARPGVERLGSTLPHQITNAVHDAFSQVAFQASGQAERRQIFSELDEYIVDRVFGNVSIMRKSNCQDKQMIPILLVDAAQRVRLTPLDSCRQQSIVHPREPHR